MRFICNKAQLTEAVTNISRVVPAKSSNQALEGIQIKAYDNQLQLTGYDMEAGITTSIQAAITEPGEIVLSARLFGDMLRKMSGDDVTLSADDKCLTEIQCGNALYTILGVPSDEFPELPQIEEESSFEIGEPVLRSMIEQTLFAVASTDIKPVHTGSLFDIGGGSFSLVSVDGYRLAMRTEPISTTQSFQFVVPGKVLGEVSKLLGEDDEKMAQVRVGSRHIVLNIGNYSLVSRLLEGEFLDYKNSIPSQGNTHIQLATRSFINSIERVSLLISDRVRSPLRVFFEQGNIRISCSTSIGKSTDQLACTLEGEAVEMGFNNKYLLDALKACGSDEVRLEISGPLSPIKVLPLQGEHFLFLVLPVRLKNEG